MTTLPLRCQYTHTHTHTLTHSLSHTHTHTHVYIYTHTQIHTHVYTYWQRVVATLCQRACSPRWRACGAYAWAYSSACQHTQQSAEMRVVAVCVARVACCRRRIRSVCLAYAQRMLRHIALRGEEWKRACRARWRACSVCVGYVGCCRRRMPLSVFKDV